MNRQALLLSGGMDSAALAWWLRPALGIFIDYGQKPAQAERIAADAVARCTGIALLAVSIDCSALGTGDLSGRDQLSGAPTPEWWPFRNQLLVTIAAAAALRHDSGIEEIVVGTVAEDRVNGDGSEAFVAGLDSLLRLQEGGLRLSAPAAQMPASELVAHSRIPQNVLAWTHSCFVGNVACLKCRGCRKHLATLERLGRRWPAADAS